MSARLRVGVVGCGLIGCRRVVTIASHEGSRCVIVADPVPAAARRAAAVAGAEAVDDWRRVVERRDLDAIVVATPNVFLAEITIAALGSGKHVLVEKPMGRNLVEAEQMSSAARGSGRLLKVGFNHRYHPAIAEAKRRCESGEIGEIINLRCSYGHGGRPGYEKEWRGSRDLAGGGELTDQGVHVIDLIHWFVGVPQSAFACLQTAVWPLGDLEDNAFALFRFDSGAVAAFHTSWTQWKNLFSLEVFGRDGAVVVNGLGGSYGTETLVAQRRRLNGGTPECEQLAYESEDRSWQNEWAEFLGATLHGRRMCGTADDGLVAMRMLDALYRSAASCAVVEV